MIVLTMSHTGVNVSDCGLFVKAVESEQLVVRWLRFHLLHVVRYRLKLCLQVEQKGQKKNGSLLGLVIKNRNGGNPKHTGKMKQ